MSTRNGDSSPRDIATRSRRSPTDCNCCARRWGRAPKWSGPSPSRWTRPGGGCPRTAGCQRSSSDRCSAVSRADTASVACTRCAGRPMPTIGIRLSGPGNEPREHDLLHRELPSLGDLVERGQGGVEQAGGGAAPERGVREVGDAVVNPVLQGLVVRRQRRVAVLGRVELFDDEVAQTDVADSPSSRRAASSATRSSITIDGPSARWSWNRSSAAQRIRRPVDGELEWDRCGSVLPGAPRKPSRCPSARPELCRSATRCQPPDRGRVDRDPRHRSGVHRRRPPLAVALSNIERNKLNRFGLRNR